MAKTNGAPSILKAPLKIEKLVAEARKAKQRVAAINRQLDKVKQSVKEYMGEWEELYDSKGRLLLATYDYRYIEEKIDKVLLKKKYRKVFNAVLIPKDETEYRPFEFK